MSTFNTFYEHIFRALIITILIFLIKFGLSDFIALIIYKNKKPSQAVFTSNTKLAHLEQPTNISSAREFIYDISSNDLTALRDVNSTIWPDQKLSRDKQDPVYLLTDNLFIDNESGTITAKSQGKKVNLTYQNTKGQSLEAVLLKEKKTGIPDKIIFRGSADVNQDDKEISSEEVVFNFKDKKLTSNTKTNVRPKTVIFKKEETN